MAVHTRKPNEVHVSCLSWSCTTKKPETQKPNQKNTAWFFCFFVLNLGSLPLAPLSPRVSRGSASGSEQYQKADKLCFWFWYNTKKAHETTVRSLDFLLLTDLMQITEQHLQRQQQKHERQRAPKNKRQKNRKRAPTLFAFLLLLLLLNQRLLS